MKILQELFGNLATFSSYAPGVETNIDLQDLQPSGESARKRVETILSVSVLKAIPRKITNGITKIILNVANLLGKFI